jgi:DNA-binding MarR family transcriptional regulator
MASTEAPSLEDAYADVALVVTALAAHVQDENVRYVAERGFGDLRPSHGYVFQHLTTGPKSIGALARALGMTPQGASKAVIELEELGYVERQVSGTDARSRAVALTDRGRAAVQASRRARARTNEALLAPLTDRQRSAFLRSLRAVTEEAGALEAMFERRLRPPR